MRRGSALKYELVRVALRISGWLQYGWKYDSPLRSDRLLWIDPAEIHRKPVTTPKTGSIPPTLVVGGDWDRDLTPIADDIVYRAFHEHFVDGKDWEDTGYIEFLTTDVSEHGGLTGSDAKKRCDRMEELFDYILENGYRTQEELEREEGFVDGLVNSSVRPPVYREVSVDVTRDGEFVWHGGIHRLVIAKLTGLEKIPVRVNIRHEKWQEIRERAYGGESHRGYRNHPDVEYLLSG